MWTPQTPPHIPITPDTMKYMVISSELGRQNNKNIYNAKVRIVIVMTITMRPVYLANQPEAKALSALQTPSQIVTKPMN